MPRVKNKKLTPAKIKGDWKRAKTFDQKWEKDAREDLRMILGDQWDQEDLEKAHAQKKPALTFNIIQPLVNLISGYQRQAKSTIRAYPEGQEDAVKGEIASRLIKNVIKKNRGNHKTSVLFEDGVGVGKAYLEPFVSFEEDYVYGKIEFKNQDGWEVKYDPKSTEYDLRDARYLTKDRMVTVDDLLELFPEQESKILAIAQKTETSKGGVDVEATDLDKAIEDDRDYLGVGAMDEADIAGSEDDEVDEDYEEKELHLIEYWYKKSSKRFMAVDLESDEAELFKTRDEARIWLIDQFLTRLQEEEADFPEERKTDYEEMRQTMFDEGDASIIEDTQKILPKYVKEIHLAHLLNEEIISDRISPYWPKWKRFPVFGFFPYFNPQAKKVLKSSTLAYQGLPRNLKDPQREKNKRRSNNLHIMTSSASAGWLSVKGAWVNKKKVKELGSAAGVMLEYNEDKPKPERIFPAGTISQGEIYMEQKSEEDIKMISGINSDALAVQDKTTSGRAIALRQQQAITILRKVFDNFGITIENIGNFLLHMLSEVYDVDRVVRVLGDDYLRQNFFNEQQFEQGMLAIQQSGGSPEEQQAQMTQLQELAEQEMMQSARQTIEEVLHDAELGEFDIAIGEGQESPTVKFMNFSTLMEMREKGILIPDEILIEYSEMPESAKKDISAAIQRAQQAQAQGAVA